MKKWAEVKTDFLTKKLVTFLQQIPMIDLRETDRKAICEIAGFCFHSPLEIWAYGSRVNGDNHEGSDLDLVIRTADLSAVKIREFVRFKEMLQRSNVPILVEVMDWARMAESFEEGIIKKHDCFPNLNLMI